jgi:hypothetical protein
VVVSAVEELNDLRLGSAPADDQQPPNLRKLVPEVVDMLRGALEIGLGLHRHRQSRDLKDSG